MNNTVSKLSRSSKLEPEAIAARLRSILGQTEVLTEPEDLIPYGFDGTAALDGEASCVCFPKKPSRSQKF